MIARKASAKLLENLHLSDYAQSFFFAGYNFSINSGSLENILRNFHYDAEVYPNRHRQICPMRVFRVRFYYVNTLKVEQCCGK